MSTLKSNYQEFLDESYANVNGVITKAEDAKVTVFDRGFLYGDSIYEVTYSENGCILFFDEHMDRLYNSARLLEMKVFTSRDEITEQVLLTLKSSKIPRAYIRIILTRGETQISLDPNISFKNNLIIIVKPLPKLKTQMYKKGIRLIISNIQRNDKKSVDPSAKSGNYLNNVMAMNEAKTKGFDDAIMVNAKDHITEGTTFNIWAIKDGIVYTPKSESGLLEGITREELIKICTRKKIDLKICEMTPKFILDADEVFITSSTRGILPVALIEKKSFGEGLHCWPQTKQLIGFYKDHIQEKLSNSKYRYL
jgi:branched-chain amino acid aminotransferase